MDMCCLSAKKRQQLQIHREIERQLQTDERNSRRELRFLILGAAESGKSTFIKQMRIIHGEGYSEADMRSFKPAVYQNVIAAIQSLINGMGILNMNFTDDNNLAYSQRLSQVKVHTVSTLEPWQLEAVGKVWNDCGVQKCYDQRKKYQISDSAKYFLSNLDRLTAPSYIPTEQDILRVRVPTNGILEYRFNIHNIFFRLIDVGGQRSERRKWLHFFENSTLFIFLAALSEYDQGLSENDNRLRESLSLLKLLRHHLGCPPHPLSYF
ncbi:hypothetical protein WMY93_019267 [Mugilogobius chulae]|uniref:Uncharacterized protein n=1 Tax=Mugilogobius chulae TaxID=88201 RepID=A0AAW0NQW6_9GOBI